VLEFAEVVAISHYLYNIDQIVVVVSRCTCGWLKAFAKEGP
jgi:hypothetical protein